MSVARRLGRCAALPALVAAGCFTVGSADEGNPVPWEAAAGVEIGRTTLAEVLARLGAPVEMHRHPDGTLLVWRARDYDFLEVSIEPGRLLAFLPAERAIRGTLDNFSFVCQLGDEDEDRLAVLVGNDHVVAGIGTHRAITPP